MDKHPGRHEELIRLAACPNPVYSLCYTDAMSSSKGDPRPIGFFDSGIGGLSIVLAAREVLPAEDVVYLADSANCPYGPKPADEIRSLARAAAGELVCRGSKAIVVACNTASVAALAQLRATFDVPFVGIVPAVKPAATATRRRRIGVLATAATLHGDVFAALVDEFAADVVVVEQAAPDLVDLVERGSLAGEETERLLRSYLEPMIADGIDSLVLGCTHYPFLRPAVEAIVGPGVRVFDTGMPVARQLRRVLDERDLLHDRLGRGTLTLITSGDPATVSSIAAGLLGTPPATCEAWPSHRSPKTKDRTAA